MPAYIALLRAINVGGTGKLKMSELKAACEAAGLRRVSTYIASGNIVFESAKPASAVQGLVSGLLRERFGLTENHTVIRTEDALARAIARNPFADAAKERPHLLLLVFLEGVPPAGAAEALARYEGPERLRLDRDQVYIDYREGVARSKLTPAFVGKALKLQGTARNWNTSNTLLGMARALAC